LLQNRSGRINGRKSFTAKKGNNLFKDTARVSLNDDWLFLPPSTSSPESNAVSIPEGCQRVQLPHAWNGDGWNYENLIRGLSEGFSVFQLKTTDFRKLSILV
jgi:hypothetical protein